MVSYSSLDFGIPIVHSSIESECRLSKKINKFLSLPAIKGRFYRPTSSTLPAKHKFYGTPLLGSQCILVRDLCKLTELVNTSGGGGLEGNLYVAELGKGKEYE